MSFHWWRLASRWDSAFYGQTDDDAIIDLEQLLVLVRAIPSGVPSLSGVVRYTCLNATTLSCGFCYANGVVGALQLPSRCSCRCESGPYPFALGALMILSHDVRAWVAPMLRLDGELQRCPTDMDALLGHALATHPALTLVDLSASLGNFDVLWSPTTWAGAPSLLAHRVRRSAAFDLVLRDFNETRQSSGGYLRYCTRPPTRRWQQRHQAQFCSGGRLRFRCAPVRDALAQMDQFSCCREWSTCSTPPALPFATRFQPAHPASTVL